MDGVKYFYASQVPEGLYVNQRVAHLRSFFEDSEYTSEYVLNIINSPVGQLQLLREMTIANTVGHITLEHIRNLLIPKMTSVQRGKITNLVRDSATAKTTSTQLLETAKRAVEMAIEESEAAALAYLESEHENGE